MKTRAERIYDALVLAGIIEATPYGFGNWPEHWKHRYGQAAAEYDNAVRAELPADVKAFVQEVEAREKLCVPGPWTFSPYPKLDARGSIESEDIQVAAYVDADEAQFIAHARTDIPRLIAIVREQATEIERMKEARVFVDEQAWNISEERDALRARVADLEASEKRTVDELMNVVRSVSKELDPKLCDPLGNEPVWIPVRRMRERLGTIEAIANAWKSEADSLDVNASTDGRIDVVDGHLIGREASAAVIARRKAYANELRTRATTILKALGGEKGGAST
jgi:hypothetical protein